MTHHIVKTTVQEADDIAKGLKPFIFRGGNLRINFGDKISFRPYQEQQMKRHEIEKMEFIVTFVTDEAPVESGFRAIGFKPIQSQGATA